MNQMQRKGIQKKTAGSNVSYLFTDNGMYYSASYKILKGLDKDYFLKSVQYFVNGQIKLTYFSSGYRSLAEMLPDINEEEMIRILLHLLKTVLDIKANGFLSCCNLELDGPETIFVDRSTMEVRLIYLPLVSDGNFSLFDSRLRRFMIQVIQAGKDSHTHMMEKVCTELADSRPLETCYKNILSLIMPSQPEQPILRLSEINGSSMFFINKKEYVMGSGRGANEDGIISNKYISSPHCKFIFENGEYRLIDLESLNKTYLNGSVLKPHTQYRVMDGDSIVMANCKFKIQIEEIKKYGEKENYSG